MDAFSSKPQKQYDEFDRWTCRGCLTRILILLGICTLIYIVSSISALITVNSNYDKWQSAQIKSYSVTVQYGIFGGDFFNIGQEIIKNGLLVKSNAGFEQPAIDRIFDKARSCAFALIFVCDIQYDDVYGYPTHLGQSDLDMGDVTEIIDLTPMPSSTP